MRFIHYKSDEPGIWVVFDTRNQRVVCICRGWYAPRNAEAICEALEHYNVELYETFHMETVR